MAYNDNEPSVDFPRTGSLSGLDLDHWRGLGSLNREHGKEPAIKETEEGQAIKQFYEESVLKKKVAMPAEELFSCPEGEPRAAMCCWTRDRQQDRNGNCGSRGRVNCSEASPGDNTDVCNVPEASSRRRRQQPVHCHGLAWPATDIHSEYNSNRYRGNVFYYVSLMDHFYERGYVEAVNKFSQSDTNGHFAGIEAPMCGCVSSFSNFSVARADCSRVKKVTHDYEIELHVSSTSTNTEDCSRVEVRAEVKDMRIEFTQCNGNTRNDLFSYYNNRIREENEADISSYVHGSSRQCP